MSDQAWDGTSVVLVAIDGSDTSISLRPARPGDYDGIAAVVDQWWGRPVLAALPRLFLDCGSIGFHRSMGFFVTGPVPDYDGPGRDFVVFERRL